MGSFLSKLIAVVITFIMLVLSPLILLSLIQDIRTERITWNAVTDYTDIVSDKGVLNENDYKEFIAKLGSSGIDYEVSIVAKSKLVFPVTGGGSGYYIDYVSSGLWKSSSGGVTGLTYLEAGDTLQIIVTPLRGSRADQLLAGILNLHTGTREYSYAASVRNDGDLYKESGSTR